MLFACIFFFFSSRRRHTRCLSDWSSDVCSSDLGRSRTAMRSREELVTVFGEIASPSARDHVPRAPGSLPSHYAPSLPVRLDARDARRGEALLAFGAEAPAGFSEVLWLSRKGGLVEAAANLFAMLRRLDRPAFTAIAVM